jgi:deazaflavin-dependent oxidoreductase (nitroreductase family)
MPIPRWIGRVNRRFTNCVTGLVAPRAPAFGIIVHRGRRSGRLYRTPVNVFRTPGGYTVALTCGPESDWVKNVLATGGCELETRGRAVHLTDPRLVHAEGQRQMPRAIRSVLRLLGVTDFLAFASAPPDTTTR